MKIYLPQEVNMEFVNIQNALTYFYNLYNLYKMNRYKIIFAFWNTSFFTVVGLLQSIYFVCDKKEYINFELNKERKFALNV